MKILLVEDDPPTLELLTFQLTAARYTVEQATDGVTALELASLWNYDLIVLDVQIPQRDGISVCRQLRTQGMTTPILILTAQADDNDIITGLDAGADDYVTKPFEISRVLARVRALLRRGATATTIPSLTWGELCLNPVLAQVTYGDQVVPVTPKEYSLLELFLRYPQRVFSRSMILDHLWTIDDSPTEGAVTNLVKDLRNRLKRSGLSENIIQTVYGLGYRLKEAPAVLGGQPKESSFQPTAQPSTLSGEKADANGAVPLMTPLGSGVPPSTLAPMRPGTAASGQMATIMARFQASLNQRLEVIESATRVLQAGALSPQQREVARDEAHRLAGGLGTFGYQEGSIHARQIEGLLSQEQPLNKADIAQLAGSLLALKHTLATPPPSPMVLAPDQKPDQRVDQEERFWPPWASRGGSSPGARLFEVNSDRGVGQGLAARGGFDPGGAGSVPGGHP
ncbi:MAG: response regulator [Leptolyngbyaceae cyanobacterium SM2_3_12]|nr:response regulator [Leptolyngbyaceae cyanobacterium SM2_3_12]